ncbi:general stress protein [Peribacillus sp. NPDC097295]|uniref:general stress protein n=1 Tax=Peribacillus sp. NPDC097295 TaxID=3364402 RepID=UPI0038043CE3
MGKTLHGVYDSSSEVNKEIQSLHLKGWDSEKITVIANKKEDVAFVNNSQNEAVDIITNQDDDSFVEKVKHFFLNEGSSDIRNRLGNLGLADSEATAYINEVEAGKFLILLDDETPVETEEHVIGQENNPLKTGIVNNPDPNLFPETTANAYQASEVDTQPGKNEELHGNSANIFDDPEVGTKRDQDKEIKSNSSEQYKKPTPKDYEGTIASDPHVDPFSADTKKALNAGDSLNRTTLPPEGNVPQDSDDNPDLTDKYIKNRINTDHL